MHRFCPIANTPPHDHAHSNRRDTNPHCFAPGPESPAYVLALFAGAVALLAIAEFLKLVTPYPVQPFTLATYGFVILFFA